MELKLNLDDISKRVFVLEKILRNTSDDKTYKLADETIDIYQNILTDITNNFSESDKESNTNFTFNKQMMLTVLKRHKLIMTHFPPEVTKFLLELCKSLSERENFFDDFNRVYEMNSFEVTDQSIYDVAKDFFDKFACNYNHIFNYLITNKLVHVKDYNFDTCSSCYYDEFFSIPYAIVNNYSNMGTYARAIHEMAHAYWFFINKNFSYKNMFYLETPANLSEFLYFENNLDNNENLISLYSYFGSLKEALFDIGLLERLMKKPLSKQSILDTMNKQNYFLNELDNYKLNYFSKINNFSNFSYAFSLIITLHLLKIFDEDFEKGTYFYNNHILRTSPNFLSDLRTMNFDLHDLDYSKELYDNYESKIIGEVRKRLK